jgi:hypothetical protein
MRFRVTTAIAATAAALALATVSTTAQATPAGCTWTPTVLSGHAGLHWERVTGMSPDGTVSVGDGLSAGPLVGVLWFGTTPADLPPVGDQVDNAPNDVNNSGVVAGYTWQDATEEARPYRYHDGAYEWLPAPVASGAVATDINEAGDVAGWYLDTTGRTNTVVWPAAAPGTFVPVGAGEPAGIDDAGRVVTSAGLIWSPGGATRTITEHRGAKPAKFADGRIVGTEYGITDEIIEWNLDGRTTRVLPNASGAAGVNALGTVVGIGREPDKSGNWTIWSGGAANPVEHAAFGGVNAKNTAFGQFAAPEGNSAAIFTCS